MPGSRFGVKGDSDEVARSAAFAAEAIEQMPLAHGYLDPRPATGELRRILELEGAVESAPRGATAFVTHTVLDVP